MGQIQCSTIEMDDTSDELLHGRCFGKMLRFLSCLDLSAFSCCSLEKVILSTQTFRPVSISSLSAFVVTHGPHTYAPHYRVGFCMGLLKILTAQTSSKNIVSRLNS